MILQAQKDNAIAQRCKKILREYYGRKFRGLIIYGSFARGTAGRFSDIDLLVLIKRPFDFYKELRRITDLLYPLQLESDQLISAKPADFTESQKGKIQLYRNAKEEGFAA